MTTVTAAPFGILPDGKQAHLYTLTNQKGWSVTLTDMGAAIRNILVPDKAGKLTDVSLCHGAFEDSIENSAFFGASCGRVANRVDGAKFTMYGKEYQLDKNGASFTIHGGKTGFSKALWQTEVTKEGSVIFTHRSPDGDQGFPGTLDVTATYTWNEAGSLGVDYKAVTDANTIVNLTNHVYFNLNGQGNGTILDHEVTMDCEFYLPVDHRVCVTGEVRKVAGTVMDFTTPHTIGARLSEAEEQLLNAGGYDHSYVLPVGDEVRRCCRAVGDQSGIVLDTYTDNPAVHFYTGNNLKPFAGKDGTTYGKYSAFCLETQLYPNFINQPAFGRHILHPGEEYHYHTDYVFSVK